MQLFLQKQSHHGPREKIQRHRISAWRTGHKEVQHQLSTIDSGSLAKSLATRKALRDKPIGMPKTPEVVWVDYFGASKSSWRIYFVLRNFECHPHNWIEEDWLELQHQLIQDIGDALRCVLQSETETQKKERKMRKNQEKIETKHEDENRLSKHDSPSNASPEHSKLPVLSAASPFAKKPFTAPTVPTVSVEAIKMLSLDDASGAFVAMMSVDASNKEGSDRVEKVLLAKKFPKDFASQASLRRTATTLGEVCDIRIVKEMPEEIELKGGMGEPLFVIAVPEGRAAIAGLCEGFELTAVISKSAAETRVEDGPRLLSLRSAEVLASSRLPNQHSIRLCFVSPFARLPRFSEKQLSDRLGFGKIRELHFHRLVLEVKYVWTLFKVKKANELHELRNAMSEDSRLVEDVKIGGSRLQRASVLRFPNAKLDLLGLEHFEDLHLPETLEAGRPRNLQNLSLKDFRTALKRAGIHWLQEPEEMILFSLIQKDREENDSWEEELADVFVIDSPGNFARVSGPGLTLHHVYHVTRKMQEMLNAKSAAKAGLMNVSLSRAEFANAMDAAGINWLTQEQTETIFRSMAGPSDESGLSLNDWMSRFVWDTMQAATELERVLKIWDRRLARRSEVLRRMSRQKEVKPSSLNFWEFHMVLTDMGVSWLNLKQQRLLFRSLDANRDGRIDTEELHRLSEKRGQIELWRLEQSKENEKGESEGHEEYEEEFEGDDIQETKEMEMSADAKEHFDSDLSPSAPPAPADESELEALEASDGLELGKSEGFHSPEGPDPDVQSAESPKSAKSSMYDNDFNSDSKSPNASPTAVSAAKDAKADDESEKSESRPFEDQLDL